MVQDKFLLVTDSDQKNIYQISLENGNTVPAFITRPAGTNPVAIAYDPVAREFYWSDTGQALRGISKYSLTTKTFITIYTDRNGR